MIYGDELAPSNGNPGGGIYTFVPTFPFGGGAPITVPAQSPFAVALAKGVFRTCWANTGRLDFSGGSTVQNSAVYGEVMCLTEEPPSAVVPAPATGTIPKVDRFIAGNGLPRCAIPRRSRAGSSSSAPGKPRSSTCSTGASTRPTTAAR